MLHMGFDTSDFIPCVISGEQAVDIHHIEARGMGGTIKEENINNIMASTRDIHLFFGDKTKYKNWLKKVHENYLQTGQPWIEENSDCEILNEYLSQR